jgi:hypothetical protein
LIGSPKRTGPDANAFDGGLDEELAHPSGLVWFMISRLPPAVKHALHALDTRDLECRVDARGTNRVPLWQHNAYLGTTGVSSLG